MAKLELENFEAFRELEGKNLPEGDWMTVTQEMINDFANANAMTVAMVTGLQQQNAQLNELLLAMKQ